MFRKMGARTSMSSSNPLNGGDKRDTGAGVQDLTGDRQSQVKPRNKVQLRFDIPLLLTIITLLIVGLVMVYSASYD